MESKCIGTTDLLAPNQILTLFEICELPQKAIVLITNALALVFGTRLKR
jgi:hypothetical protein